jgi:hypothetical protein
LLAGFLLPPGKNKAKEITFRPKDQSKHRMSFHVSAPASADIPVKEDAGEA